MDMASKRFYKITDHELREKAKMICNYAFDAIIHKRTITPRFEKVISLVRTMITLPVKEIEAAKNANLQKIKDTLEKWELDDLEPRKFNLPKHIKKVTKKKVSKVSK